METKECWESRRGDCEYCGDGPTERILVPEPTEHETYANTSRVLCASCREVYKSVPYGFSLES